MKSKIAMIVLILLTAACTLPQTEVPAMTEIPQAGMANPASTYCVEQGFKSEIRTAADGSQSGVCIFPDGSECEEWAYFRGECVPGTEAQGIGLVFAAQAVPAPVGMIVDMRGSETGMKGSDISGTIVAGKVTIYALDGSPLGEISAPYADVLHAAGKYQGRMDFPLVYHSLDPDTRQQSIKVSTNGQTADLISLGEGVMVSNLAGIPGGASIAFTTFHPVDSHLQTQFFFGSVNSFPAAPAFTLDSTESRYWKVIAVQEREGQSPGLWFTREPWGIGGDIVFMYHEGLSYLDILSGQVTEVLPAGATLSGLSSDQSWIAYSVRGAGGSFEFYIRNLAGGDALPIPLLPQSDRGAGDAAFSPSSRYVAWREAQGSLMDGTFQQRIRVAALDGQIINLFEESSLFTAAGMSAATIQPVSWFDDDNLLVQATNAEKPHNGALLKVNAATGETTFLAYGFFEGWLYP